MKCRFTAKQAKALPMLASGMTGTATAKAVGVKASTVSQWLNHCPDFAQVLQELRERAANEAIAELRGALSAAVSEVRDLMMKSKADAIRLKAALFVIEQCSSPKTIQEKNVGNDFGSKMDLGMILRGLGVSHAH